MKLAIGAGANDTNTLIPPWREQHGLGDANIMAICEGIHFCFCVSFRHTVHRLSAGSSTRPHRRAISGNCVARYAEDPDVDLRWARGAPAGTYVVACLRPGGFSGISWVRARGILPEDHVWAVDFAHERFAESRSYREEGLDGGGIAGCT